MSMFRIVYIFLKEAHVASFLYKNVITVSDNKI